MAGRPRKNHRRECKFAGLSFAEFDPYTLEDCICVDEIRFEGGRDEAPMPVDPARVKRAARVWKTIYLADPPDGFDSALRALFMLGADDDLITYAITVTATSLNVDNKFAYMAGIVRNVLGRTLDAERDEDD